MRTGRPWPTRDMTLREKLDHFSIPEPNSGCLLWLGTVVRWGYGMLHFQGKYAHAHRWAWIAAHGPIPAGLFVCHKCDVPGCVNPGHLFLGTPGDNMKDMARKGRVRGAAIPLKERT